MVRIVRVKIESSDDDFDDDGMDVSGRYSVQGVGMKTTHLY